MPLISSARAEQANLADSSQAFVPGARLGLRSDLDQCRSGSRMAPSALVRGQGAWTDVAAGVLEGVEMAPQAHS